MCVCVDYGLDVHFLTHLQSIRCFRLGDGGELDSWKERQSPQSLDGLDIRFVHAHTFLFAFQNSCFFLYSRGNSKWDLVESIKKNVSFSSFLIKFRHLLIHVLAFVFLRKQWDGMNGMTGWMPGKTCWISRKDRALDIWNWNKKSCTWSWRNISGRSLQPTFVCFCYYCVLRETVQPLARQNSGWRWPWKIRSKIFPCARRSVNLLTRGISSDCDTSQSLMAGTGKNALIWLNLKISRDFWVFVMTDHERPWFDFVPNVSQIAPNVIIKNSGPPNSTSCQSPSDGVRLIRNVVWPATSNKS